MSPQGWPSGRIGVAVLQESTSKPNEYKTCSKCGESKPATAEYFNKHKTGRNGLRSFCKVCHAQDSTQRYWANPESSKAKRKTRYWANREKYIDNASRWYTANRDHALDLARQRRASRPNEVRQWKAENRERVRAYNRQYRIANPERIRAIQQKRKALQHDLPATLTPAEYQDTLKRFDYSCAYCGRPESEVGKLHQEHVIPLSQGGGYTADNIVPACGPCNRKKGGRTPEQAGMKLRKL